MKKNLFRTTCLIIAFVMMAGVLAACGNNAAPGNNAGDQPASPAPAATDDRTWEFTVSFSHAEVVSPNWHRLFGPELESKSNGRISSTFFWAGSLLSIPEAPRGLQDGVADIVNLPAPNYIDILPLNTRIMQLPFIGMQDIVLTTEIYMQLFNEFPEMREEAENLGIKILGATPLGRYNLKLTFSDPVVRLPEQLRGRTIVPYKNEILYLLSQNNAAGTFVPPAQIYENLERGVVEGYFADWNFAGFFGLTDLINQHVQFGDYGAYQDINLFAMSLDTWNALPADLQQVVQDVLWNDGGYKEIWEGDTLPLINAQREAAEAKNDIVTVLTPDEMEVWKSYILPLYQQTIDEINEMRGDDAAQRIYNRLLEIMAERF